MISVRSLRGAGAIAIFTFGGQLISGQLPRQGLGGTCGLCGLLFSIDTLFRVNIQKTDGKSPCLIATNQLFLWQFSYSYVGLPEVCHEYPLTTTSMATTVARCLTNHKRHDLTELLISKWRFNDHKTTKNNKKRPESTHQCWTLKWTLIWLKNSSGPLPIYGLYGCWSCAPLGFLMIFGWIFSAIKTMGCHSPYWIGLKVERHIPSGNLT